MCDLVNTTTINGKKITGRFSVSSEGFIDFLSRYIEGTKDYIEIGTLFGGSAIIAGLNCSGKVCCIDPLDGYYGTGKPDDCGILPTAAIVEENWAKFGLAPERLEIFQHKHPPFPPSLKDKRFDVAYIDGGHKYEETMADWLALKDKVDKYIIFDNTEKEPVSRVFAEAQKSEDWEFVEEIGTSIKTGVIKRRI
jgi:predicted O-methyltransferase YrrM